MSLCVWQRAESNLIDQAHERMSVHSCILLPFIIILMSHTCKPEHTSLSVCALDVLAQPAIDANGSLRTHTCPVHAHSHFSLCVLDVNDGVTKVMTVS